MNQAIDHDPFTTGLARRHHEWQIPSVPSLDPSVSARENRCEYRQTTQSLPFRLLMKYPAQHAHVYGVAEASSPASILYPLQSSPTTRIGNKQADSAFSGWPPPSQGPTEAYRLPYRAITVDDIESDGARCLLTAEPHPPAQDAAYGRLQAPSRRSAYDPPIVQGIHLIPTHQLPDRHRSIFTFPLFNAVQSKCFPVVYRTDDNFVLSSPTGSGKTAILELAICRLVSNLVNGTFKVVYQAPTKSLCSERQRDWQSKFAPFDLQVAELTGDTDPAQMRNVQHASIIITTPEKWDSITRKWKDHQKLMEMVKLFLIDEVHTLKEDRGAVLEAVVSRMKSVGSDVRFIALSATVPNSQDIAKWLGKNPVSSHIPAPRETFGEEFRPVRLQKHVCGYHGVGNDFAFEKMLNNKLPGVIAKWSQRKPIMVFCFTRAACVDTAKLLANWWATKSPRDQCWEAPRRTVSVESKDLRGKHRLAERLCWHD